MSFNDKEPFRSQTGWHFVGLLKYLNSFFLETGVKFRTKLSRFDQICNQKQAEQPVDSLQVEAFLSLVEESQDDPYEG